VLYCDGRRICCATSSTLRAWNQAYIIDNLLCYGQFIQAHVALRDAARSTISHMAASAAA